MSITVEIRVRRHPEVSPLHANLARVESIVSQFESEGWRVARTDSRTLFEVSHDRCSAWAWFLMKHGLDYCETTVKKSNR